MPTAWLTATPPFTTKILDIRWPVGPTAPLVKPKWNVSGRIDPIVFCLSCKDFSLFRFFVSYNLLEIPRALHVTATNGWRSLTKERLVLFGYEKTGLPPTTYSIGLSTDKVTFRFLLDEQESPSRKVQGMMDVQMTSASWSLIKLADCISNQRANVDSIRLTQTSNRKELCGFPDLLLPLPANGIDLSTPQPCLLKFTSTTHPSGDNVKTLHLDSAGIYLIVPAWQHVMEFFRLLPSSPEVFLPEEMPSIMQVGDRFYRMSKVDNHLNADETTDSNGALPPPQLQASKQFRLTLTSPRIILVADAANPQNDCQCLTLSMAHLDLLRQVNVHSEAHSVYCDGLEMFTGMANNLAPHSSLLCPLSIAASLNKTLQSTSSPQTLSGWVWSEELQARAAYTDLIHSIDVLGGVKKQLLLSSPNQGNRRPIQQTKAGPATSKANEEKKPAVSQTEM